MKKVTAYAAKDGSLFETKKECHRHNARIAMFLWYNTEGVRISGAGWLLHEIIIPWTIKHRKDLIHLLSAFDED